MSTACFTWNTPRHLSIHKQGGGYILKKLFNNHSEEMEALRRLKYKLKEWDQKKFEVKVKEIENKDQPDWIKHVENTR